MKHLLTLTSTTLVAIFITACSPDAPPAPKEMPAVNEENCKTHNILKMEDSPERQKFADACFRRGEYKPSSGRTW